MATLKIVFGQKSCFTEEGRDKIKNQINSPYREFAHWMTSSAKIKILAFIAVIPWSNYIASTPFTTKSERVKTYILKKNRGCYMAAQRYEISLRVLKTILRVSSANDEADFVCGMFDTMREASLLVVRTLCWWRIWPSSFATTWHGGHVGGQYNKNYFKEFTWQWSLVPMMVEMFLFLTTNMAAMTTIN